MKKRDNPGCSRIGIESKEIEGHVSVEKRGKRARLSARSTLRPRLLGNRKTVILALKHRHNFRRCVLMSECSPAY